MGEVKWTNEQNAAIHHRKGALLVSAAAGSGKTAVLVQHAVWMITRKDAPISADGLLILTFTNAAAQELRARIATEVEKKLAKNPTDLQLRKQKLLLGRAFIGTMDAFCQQLVREHFDMLQLSPDVQLGQNAKLAQLAQIAMEETMEEMYAQEDFAQFTSLYGRARSDEEAEKTILAIYGQMRTLPAPMQRLQDFERMYDEKIPIEQTAWGKELLGVAAETAQAAQKLTLQCIQRAEQDDVLCVYAQVLSGEREGILRLCGALKQGGWDEAVECAERVSFGRLPPAKGADEAEKKALKNMRDTVKKLIDDIKKYMLICTEEQFWEDVRDARPLVRVLAAAVRMYDERFSELKNAENVLEFSDYGHLTLRLLLDDEGKKTQVANALSKRYAAVMVDEYQDTNELQDAIYRALAQEDGSNLFCVGDVKQSIYRFRNANPDIFLRKMEKWAEYDFEKEEQQGPATLCLGHNFRSARAVIDGVNFLFERLMSPAVGEMSYGDRQRLIAAASAEQEGSFEVCVLTGNEEDEAAHVAQRIQRMLSEKTPVWEGGQMRECKEEDFCILLRGKKHMPLFVRALAERGISAVAELGGEVMKSPEVLPLIAVLAAIDNPGDDVQLASALLGPIFGFTLDEVSKIRAGSQGVKLWAALLADESQKAQQMVSSIRMYRVLSAQLSPQRLCEEIVQRTGYLSAVAAMEKGGAKRDNLLRFIRWVGQVSDKGGQGLFGVVRLAVEGARLEVPAAKSIPGHVSILTIHKSKGLEFPFCFVADTSHGFNMQDLSQRVQVHEELGIGLTLRCGGALYPTLAKLAIRKRMLKNMLSEELRTLYVALTRAKQHLVVCYTCENAQVPIEKWALAQQDGEPDTALLSRAKSLGDFVLAGVMSHRSAKVLWEMCELPMQSRVMAQEEIIVTAEDISCGEEENCSENTAEERYELTAVADAQIAQSLCDAFEKKPPRMALSGVRAKWSVSELTKQHHEDIRKRPSFMYEQGLNAAEKGSAQHAFMQFADFAAAGQDAQKEIARLVQEGYMLPAVAKAVDIKGVRTFLASPLAGRIAAAKQVLREYDFITTIPAGQVSCGLPPELASERVMVQGIADLVLVSDEQIELVDYKTDRVKSTSELVVRYQKQLQMYAGAISKRWENKRIKCTVWSFALAKEADVPLEEVL